MFKDIFKWGIRLFKSFSLSPTNDEKPWDVLKEPFSSRWVSYKFIIEEQEREIRNEPNYGPISLILMIAFAIFLDFVMCGFKL
jgi:hypothetical protein